MAKSPALFVKTKKNMKRKARKDRSSSSNKKIRIQQQPIPTTNILETISDANLWKHEIFYFLAPIDFYSIMLTCELFHSNAIENELFLFYKWMCKKTTIPGYIEHLPSKEFLLSKSALNAKSVLGRIHYGTVTLNELNEKIEDVETRKRLLALFPFELKQFETVDWFQEEMKEIDELSKAQKQEFMNNARVLPLVEKNFHYLLNGKPRKSISDNCYHYLNKVKTVRDNRFITMLALLYHPEALRFKAFKNDREVVLVAVQCSGTALKYTSPTMKSNRTVIQAAIITNGLALEYVPEKSKTKDLVLRAIQGHIGAYNFIPKPMMLDKDVAIALVSQRGKSIESLPENLQKDRDVLHAAIKKNGTLIDSIGKDYLNDREIFLSAVKSQGSILRLGSTTFHDDREIVLAALSNNPYALEYASDRLRDDKEIVIMALQQNITCLKYASQKLQQDSEFIETAQQAAAEYRRILVIHDM
jgi:hypothetical protein